MTYVDNLVPEVKEKAETAQSIIDRIKTKISSASESGELQDPTDITQWFGETYKKSASGIRPDAPVKPISIVEQTIQKCDELAIKGKTFHDEYIVRGNQALYELLADIYGLAIAIDKSVHKETILKKLRAILKERDQKVQINTPALTILVKYVVGADRKRASNYSRVLAVAMAENLSANELADYISRRGGISQIHEVESKYEAKILGSKISKERLDLCREFFNYSHWTNKGSFKYDEPIVVHNFDKTNGAESANFCFFMTVYDYQNDVYRIIDGHDFGKTYEDSILRMIIKTFPNDPEVIKNGLNRFKEKLLSIDTVSDSQKDMLRKGLAKSSEALEVA